jgi:cytochrome c oxidase cbb3-type subunit III
MIKKVFIGILTGLSLTVIASSLYAQTGKPDAPTDTYVYLILGALLFTLAVLFASVMIFEAGERKERKIVAAAAGREVQLTDHEYDGIQELDNPAPAWFQFLFYFTIAFAIVYMINYHLTGKQNTSNDEYLQEMTIAQMQKDELIKTGALINESNVVALTDKADLDKGKEIFAANCVNCHAADGGGGVGPNLTDQNWIHGGGIKNIFTTIKYGVPAKGMITWQSQLNPKQIQQTASYVLTLQGTKPANPKAPEGSIWVDSTLAAPKDTLKK